MEYAVAQERAVVGLSVDARARFIVRTYMHLAGAILAFTGILTLLFQSGIAYDIAPAMAGNWMLVLGAFILVGWLASRAAHRARSLTTQYLALAAFVVVEAFIFVPILAIALTHYEGTNLLPTAAVTTLTGFGGLTIVAFMTRKDFSFLGALLRWVGIAALVGIGASLIFGFQLGTWFSIGMIVFAGGAILYDTSNVLHHFPEDRYVGAALELFASVALLFFYVLRLFMSRD